MKTSELIIELTNKLVENGDVEVIIEYDENLVSKYSDIGEVGILETKIGNEKYIKIKM